MRIASSPPNLEWRQPKKDVISRSQELDRKGNLKMNGMHWDWDDVQLQQAIHLSKISYADLARSPSIPPTDPALLIQVHPSNRTSVSSPPICLNAIFDSKLLGFFEFEHPIMNSKHASKKKRTLYTTSILSLTTNNLF
ncbi:unnamed protein product [Nesidiocoris tenuis]|uniref:Uncharacterized protein n=1 Tax=Nesidiocoris tenuis TaxID=355587 RepID=A0A6H5G310_9HEMI|nr:unnamed protein product [Nesidiocoris tenuis]